ncbi:hypothetical protein PQR41_27850 [Paraburkholderia xenovorans]
MHHARKAGGSDYSSYHGVRKAGKKVRYLLEILRPPPEQEVTERDEEREAVTETFWRIEHVVASPNLLAAHHSSLTDGANPNGTLRALEKEQKRRITAASRLL